MKINRKLSIEKLLNKLPFENKYLDEEVVSSIKNEGPDETEVEFFKLDKYATNEEVLKEYDNRGLTPDAGAVITLLTKSPEVLDEKPYIAVQLEDNKFVAFGRGGGGRRVDSFRYGRGWIARYWLAGRRVRKSSDTLTLSSSESFDPLVLEITYAGKRYKVIEA